MAMSGYMPNRGRHDEGEQRSVERVSNSWPISPLLLTRMIDRLMLDSAEAVLPPSPAACAASELEPVMLHCRTKRRPDHGLVSCSPKRARFSYCNGKVFIAQDGF